MKNIRLVLVPFLYILSIGMAFCQNFDYGNDWYYQNVQGKAFVKLKIAEDGVYRVSRADLDAAGLPLSGIDAKFLHLFYRGQKVPRFIKKQSNLELDFLEFYGKKNDGIVDSIMYRNEKTGKHEPNIQPNKRLSLYSDTSVYYLVINTAFPGQNIGNNPFQASSLSPEPYFMYESIREFPAGSGSHYVYAGGSAVEATLALNSDFTLGEGFNGPEFGLAQSRIFSSTSTSTPAHLRALATPDAVNGTVTLSARIHGTSNTGHHLNIFLDNDAAPLIDAYPAVTGWDVNGNPTAGTVYVANFSQNTTRTLGANTTLRFVAGVNMPSTATDNNNILWFSLKYPRAPKLNGANSIKISDWQKSTPALFKFDNPAGTANVDSLYVYDLTLRTRTVGIISQAGSGKEGQFLLPGAPQTRQIYLVSTPGIKTPIVESTHSFADLKQFAGKEMVIITSRKLAASAAEYKTYRDTCTFNQIPPVVVYTDQIYEEYGYGSLTPWAIKRFCKDAIDNWTVKPKYFLLWGKGGLNPRQETYVEVPTFGYPISDIEFVAHFDQDTFSIKQEAAIGRVNVYNDAMGLDYLAKVNDYEHKQWESWMKEGVLLGGGSNTNEQDQIALSLRDDSLIYVNIPLGGNVTKYQKRTSSTIDPTAATYHDKISEGVGLIHFFGHSSSNKQDINMRLPSEYGNHGRYPFILAQGCYGGDFAGESPSFGEEWVAAPGRGAIGYLANSSSGFLTNLKDYSKIFYKKSYNTMIGNRIGDILTATLNEYEITEGLIQGNPAPRNHGRQINLQADPTVKLYYPEKPDLEINEASVYFNPEVLTSHLDTFEVKVIVRNLGRLVPDSFVVSLEQGFSDGSWKEHRSQKINLLSFQDTLTFKVGIDDPIKTTGTNTFDIFVDSTLLINEYYEDNNRLIFDKLIPGNIPAPLYPYEFAVIPHDTVSLGANSYFINRDSTVNYVFEIDTTYNFSSPFLINSGAVQGKSNLCQWRVPVNLSDSSIYYWRVRLADIPEVLWVSSTFRYINNKKGWAQADYPQFVKDTRTDVDLNIIQKKWDFNPVVAEYEIEKGAVSTIYINGGIYNNTGSGALGYQVNGLVYLRIDPITLYPIEQIAVPTNGNQVSTAFMPGQSGQVISDFNALPDGYYFFLATNDLSYTENWSDSFFDFLEDLGASPTIRNLPPNGQFMLFGQKGNPSATVEITTPDASGLYKLNRKVYSREKQGSIKSTLVGPSLGWNNLIWNWKSLDPSLTDKIFVDVMAIRRNSTDSVALTVTNSGNYDISWLDAERFPYVRLRARMKDSTYRTAPQLDHWHILYEPAPDAIVDPFIDYAFRDSIIEEGQSISLNIGAINPTPPNMDSLLVNFKIERPNRTKINLGDYRYAPLPAHGRIKIPFVFPTSDSIITPDGNHVFVGNMEGSCKFIIELNPDDDQPEQYSFNNFFEQHFRVNRDKYNPILDVTFDGKHILDNDIVSPNPEIVAYAKDENKFLAMTDTSTFKVYLKTPNDIDYKRIAFGPNLQFFPAQLPENKAKIVYYPGRDSALSEEGPLGKKTYYLRIQSADARGNTSGSETSLYQVSFEVVKEHTMTNVFNYPNPFSTSTRFVYTLTGSEVPEFFQIHIYTISGKLVKVIDLAELGDVHIGKNITDYAWDGTDEYGDRLANGVYLYRVVTKTQNKLEASRLDDTGANSQNNDKLFKNGWGKMYIMR